MGGEPLTKDQLRKYVSDGDKWIKTTRTVKSRIFKTMMILY